MNLAYFGGGGFQPVRRRGILPPAIKTLLLLNIGIFLLDFVLHSLRSPIARALFDPPVGILPLYTNLRLFRPWQLVTYMFLHAGLLHLLFNMFGLWMFGAEIEERWGTRHFAVYYFLCGIGGGLVQMVLPAILNLFMPPLLQQRPLPVVGASGAVYGVLLAFGMMFPDRPLLVPIFFIPIAIPARMLVVIYFLLSAFGGLRGSGYVAHFAHLGGMLFGFGYIKWQQHKRRFMRW